ncbi:TPA: DUF4422 domain-containing protein [Campylobacter jejuni]|uniref:Putative glycosyltransferase n=1 Tax=Campylobacter jejuni subsp. jejuni TaxID=32022 RepID=A0A0S2CFK2_CAMJU|nr:MULTISPECIES: DUF4422 domain-containing protein [Campylobacter]ALN43856.1 putative glycosyltransferase [Campylobacter jejuni subsp. jejuni]TEY42436.1 DUF4422 domain-containing protein [Campylobacter sp. CH185]EAI2525468.1 DUF4422 domain-containing protein [Campylobacter jejuni]EAJ8980782.1 DUF4422 domain-containing protein [Campylobacter jejuni]EAJ9013873.1 DUF4422 domain-containing protein [Campylobacter jejuni]
MKEKKENQNPSIKILVGYHKPAELLKDDILTPIHLGRALATEASKDGEMSKEDFQWMCENMIGDDTGDNISHLNRYLNELTGIYWAWKNYDKLGNPDYIGYAHYRRHFIISDNISDLVLHENGWPFIESIKNIYNYRYDALYDIIKDIDLIIPEKFYLDSPLNLNFYKYKCIEDWYPGIVYHKQNVRLTIGYKLLIYLLKNNEKYKNEVENFISGTSYYPCNMFIMKKELFFSYCSFIFELIFLVYDIMKEDLEVRNTHEKRELGFCAEYLTSIFIQKNIKENCKFRNKYVAIFQ